MVKLSIITCCWSTSHVLKSKLGDVVALSRADSGKQVVATFPRPLLLFLLSQRCETDRFDVTIPVEGHLVAKWALQGIFRVH